MDKKIHILPHFRKVFVFTIDAIFIFLSFYIAFILRFEGNISLPYFKLLYKWTPILILLRLTSFYYFNLYRGIYRYASVNDLLNITKAVIVSSVLFIIAVVFARGLVGFPRSVFVIDTLLILFFIGGSRFFLRIYRELFTKRNGIAKKRILIIGAGDAGNSILREIKTNSTLFYEVIGFIDDKKKIQNMNIQGVPILGTREDINRIVKEKNIDEIIIAIPSANKHVLKPIIESCEKTKAKLKTVPSIQDLINGRVSINQIREVQIEDLLGREEVEIDTDNIRKYIYGKKVLVTGAGGSIGSEICRQVIKFHPKMLILHGRGEYSIYQIYNELISKGTKTEIMQILGGTRTKKKFEGIFKKYLPNIIFHAGADKHVPILEHNPDEAVINNIIGTQNVLEVAEKYGAEKVVCISTDKAADPVNIMGCAKRVAELIIQNRKLSSTVSIGVRFGNVLGSRGSVIPLFKKQIEKGGPVTVTHPEMVRYFMTISEAAQLVLQAGAIGTCGDIFLLDMGSPVKIVNLAEQMIKLSGFEPYKDIEIKFIGLRPGEKLVESLTGKDEKLTKSFHPKIFVISNDNNSSISLEKDIDELKKLAFEMDENGIIEKLKEIVPNYRPNYSFNKQTLLRGE